jgi:hypothetical protein
MLFEEISPGELNTITGGFDIGIGIQSVADAVYEVYSSRYEDHVAKIHYEADDLMALRAPLLFNFTPVTVPITTLLAGQK